MNQCLNTLIFSMDHPWDQKIEVGLIEAPGVTNSHVLGGYRVIIGLCSNNL